VLAPAEHRRPHRRSEGNAGRPGTRPRFQGRSRGSAGIRGLRRGCPAARRRSLLHPHACGCRRCLGGHWGAHEPAPVSAPWPMRYLPDFAALPSSQPNSACPRTRAPAATVNDPALMSPITTPVCIRSTSEASSTLPSSSPAIVTLSARTAPVSLAPASMVRSPWTLTSPLNLPAMRTLPPPSIFPSIVMSAAINDSLRGCRVSATATGAAAGVGTGSGFGGGSYRAGSFGCGAAAGAGRVAVLSFQMDIVKACKEGGVSRLTLKAGGDNQSVAKSMKRRTKSYPFGESRATTNHALMPPVRHRNCSPDQRCSRSNDRRPEPDTPPAPRYRVATDAYVAANRYSAASPASD